MNFSSLEALLGFIFFPCFVTVLLLTLQPPGGFGAKLSLPVEFDQSRSLNKPVQVAELLCVFCHANSEYTRRTICLHLHPSTCNQLLQCLAVAQRALNGELYRPGSMLTDSCLLLFSSIEKPQHVLCLGFAHAHCVNCVAFRFIPSFPMITSFPCCH